MLTVTVSGWWGRCALLIHFFLVMSTRYAMTLFLMKYENYRLCNNSFFFLVLTTHKALCQALSYFRFVVFDFFKKSRHLLDLNEDTGQKARLLPPNCKNRTDR